MNIKRFVFVFVAIGLSGIVHSEPSQNAPSDRDEIVRLEPVRIRGGYFDYFARFSKGTRNVLDARVTWVSPPVYKIGLRPGDLMTSVDGKPISGMAYDRFVRLLDLDAKGNENTVFEFSGRRYVVMAAKIVLTIGGSPPGVPNKSPDPTTMPGMPPAGQESRHG